MRPPHVTLILPRFQSYLLRGTSTRNTPSTEASHLRASTGPSDGHFSFDVKTGLVPLRHLTRASYVVGKHSPDGVLASAACLPRHPRRGMRPPIRKTRHTGGRCWPWFNLRYDLPTDDCINGVIVSGAAPKKIGLTTRRKRWGPKDEKVTRFGS